MVYDILLISFFACTTIQIVYYTIYVISFSRYKKDSGYTDQSGISVVICAHDEEENLRNLLPKLYDQQYPEYEIIVVEDRSNDGTYDLLLEETRRNTKLKMVKVNHKPDNFNAKKYGLTLGIKAAKHDRILLTDADCEPHNNQWIASMAARFDDKAQFNLGFSFYTATKGFLNTFIRFETLWTAMQYIGMALAGRPYMGVGRNLAYRKALFISKKGFTPHLGLTGGDDDLFVNQHATKENTRITLGEDALVYSHPKKSWKAFFRQKTRHLSVGKYYKLSDKVILGTFSFTHILFWLILTILLLLRIELYLVAGSFLIRTLLIYLTFNVICKKLGVKFNFWGLVFLDLIFVFYYLITGATALFTKRVRWS
ncbi:glycosyltransferase [Fulvivirga sp. 29W222]|uniref:Glycosyltransferase n=1 Tax=Fulvivirga marina TaxID=2494733 RepID=A0A937G1Y2_9BACT|nr:glycosyltransferase [Fulvivirga marina]MBL6448701.1 glycosyltransferase [Fulvivirga marina]